MLDFNHGSGSLAAPKKIPLSDLINNAIDAGLQAENALREVRDYLGGSRLGIECDRALQYEYLKQPKDQEFSGRTLRIFATGHYLEDLMVEWMRLAGFELIVKNHAGDQFGWSQLGGKMAGHLDGILLYGPPEFGPYPRLWEGKTMKASRWKAAVKHGLGKENGVYLSQVTLYQNYYHLAVHPAILTALNKDTSELHHFEIPFNAPLAQRRSDRGVKVIEACEAGEWLPRCSNTKNYLTCKLCDYPNTCWAEND